MAQALEMAVPDWGCLKCGREYFAPNAPENCICETTEIEIKLGTIVRLIKPTDGKLGAFGTIHTIIDTITAAGTVRTYSFKRNDVPNESDISTVRDRLVPVELDYSGGTIDYESKYKSDVQYGIVIRDASHGGEYLTMRWFWDKSERDAELERITEGQDNG